MEENKEKVLSEIETLKKIKKTLEEDNARLQVLNNNLEAQAHTAQVKDEQDLKLKEAQMRTKLAAEEHQLEAKRVEVESRIDSLEEREAKLKDRTKEVEAREQKLIDLEDRVADLNDQRSNFEMYKVGVEKELVGAKETINQAEESVAKIKSEKDMLAGREAKIKEQEKYWNDEIGKLELDKRKFQIEREQVLGLAQAKKEKKPK